MRSRTEVLLCGLLFLCICAFNSAFKNHLLGTYDTKSVKVATAFAGYSTNLLSEPESTRSGRALMTDGSEAIPPRVFSLTDGSEAIPPRMVAMTDGSEAIPPRVFSLTDGSEGIPSVEISINS